MKTEFFEIFLYAAFVFFLISANGNACGVTGLVLYGIGRLHGKMYD